MNANITVLKDESLGGVEREYREVKRKGSVGERIKIVAAADNGAWGYANGEVHTVISSDGDTEVNIRPDGTEGSEIYVEQDEYVTLEPTDIIRINTPDGDGEAARYRMVDRKATVGERVIVTKVVDNYGFFSLGNIGVFGAGGWVDFNGQGNVGYNANDGFWRFGENNGRSEYRVLEPLENAEPLSAKPAPDQAAEIIVALTTRVVALEQRVAALETPKSRPATDAAITYALAKLPRMKSPQEIRDDIVKRAKEDVADLRKFAGTKVPNDFVSFWPHTGHSTDYSPMHTVEYVVNRDKRTVVTIIRSDGRGHITRGIAKCAPGDVFNSHIGRAIALRRALGLAVPAEYFEAPNPTEVRVGDVIDYGDRRGSLRVIPNDGDLTINATFLSTAEDNIYRAVFIDDSRISEAESDSAEPRKEVA